MELGNPCCIQVDRAHTVYVGSTSLQSVDTGAPGGAEEQSVAHLTKFDASGGFGWTREIKAGGVDILSSLAVDGDDIYAVGTTGTAQMIYGEPELRPDTDAFLAKFADGRATWPAPLEFGTEGEDGATGVAVGEGGVLYVTGITEASEHFKRLAGATEYQAFLAQFDTNDRARRVRQAGMAGQVEGGAHRGRFGRRSNVYVLGGGDMAFLGAYNNLGVEPWIYALEFTRPVDIAATAAGIYEVSGDLVAKRDVRGHAEWARQFAGGGHETQVLAAGPRGLYVAGKVGGRAFIGELVELRSRNR